MYLNIFYALFLSLLFDPWLGGMELPQTSTDKKYLEWIESKPLDPSSNFKHSKKDYKIRNRELFNVPGATEVIVFFVIHGTNLDPIFTKKAGPYNPNYFDKNHDDEQLYNHFMAFAAWYGKRINKNVELLSFRWPGANFHHIRQRAAEFLNSYIQKNYSEEELAILAHSHGCNVANILSKIIDRPISLLVFFACPVREFENKESESKSVCKEAIEVIEDKLVDEYIPEKFCTLIYFFSTGDFVAAAGSIAKGTAAAAIFTPVATAVVSEVAYRQAYKHGIKLVIVGGAKALNYAGKGAISTLFGPYATTVVFLVQNKDFIFGAVRSVQIATSTLSVKESANHLKERMEGANVFTCLISKKVIGVRVQIDGNDIGHSSVPAIATVLPEVFSMLAEKYPHHAALSSKFDLNIDYPKESPFGSADNLTIDDKAIKANKESLCFSIREEGSSENFKYLDPELRSQIDANSLKLEANFSEEQKSKFKEKHNKDIDAKKANSSCNVM